MPCGRQLHGDRAFRRELRAYLRRELQGRPEDAPIVSDLKVVDSKENVLIQLADMVAGTLRRFAEGEKGDAAVYRDLIAKRLEDMWDRPRDELPLERVRPSSYPGE